MADDELHRLRDIERLLRELFTLEDERAQHQVRASDPNDDRDESELEAQLRHLLGAPPKNTEPELQHQYPCRHPTEPCNCRRSHLLAEARRLADMIARQDLLATHLFNATDSLIERGDAALEGQAGIGDAYLELHRAAALITEILAVNYIERPG